MRYLFSVLFALFFLVPSVSLLYAQSIIGYSNGNAARKNGVRFGTSSTQGLAIYIPTEKSKLLKGSKVTAIQSVFGTSQTKNMTLFITKDLNSFPSYSQSISGGRTVWTEFKLDTPYVIDGEAFYIGYYFDVAESYKPLLFDESQDFGQAYFWALNDGMWEDVSCKGYGAANIRMVVNDVKPFNDIIIKPVFANGYYKEGIPYIFGGQIFNFGTEPVSSFDILCQVGEGQEVVYNVSDKNLQTGETFDFALPEYIPTESGALPFRVSVANINKKSDSDTTDNFSRQHTYIYPSWTKKSILIETFTGQTCSNCPAGHNALEQTLGKIEDSYVIVSHHSGYNPDLFTTMEDIDYTWFYNSSSLYAPACMVNRSPYEDGLSSVVFIPTNTKSLNAAINKSLGTPPYVNIEVDNNFDENTKKGCLNVHVHTFVEPSSLEHRLNVFLCQNNITAYQSNGGSDYNHNHVFRAALSGTWGNPISLEEGKNNSYMYEYSIPEKIESTYYKGTGQDPVYVPTNVNDLYFVIFVGDVSNSPLDCVVYNSACLPVNQNVDSGIEHVASEELKYSIVDRTFTLYNKNCYAKLYNPAGSCLGTVQPNDNVLLTGGIYIIKLFFENGSVLSRKIIVK